MRTLFFQVFSKLCGTANKAMQLKAKIKNLALKNHIPAQAVLQNFMLERLLERISISKYKDMVVLKGG